jgi:NAD(P)-dependent dehydrogenase (short-subunit alcohol dehydrogenase family)
MAKKKKAAGALAGRRIVVTGASSGMGLAIAERFAAEGAALALIDVNERILKEVGKRTGALALKCDVSSHKEVAAFVQRAARALGGIDGIVNAAGIYDKLPFDKITPERWQRMLGVNLTGPYLLVYSALPHLRRAKRATIVNIASTGFIRPGPGMAHYVSTKGGLVGLTRALALELAPKIRANAICPGMIRTGITRALYPTEKQLEQVAASRILAGRIGEPDEIAQAALFLTSDASSFVNGTIVTVDGGSTFY